MGVPMNTLLKIMAFLLSRDILPDRFLNWHKKTSNLRNIFVTKTMPFSGVKIKLNIGDHVQYWMYMRRAYEYENLEYFSKIVNQGVFIDIGANVGNYSLSLCKKANKVFAVEASKNNCQRIIETLKMNKIDNVEVIHKAAYKVSGVKVKLYLSGDNAGRNSLLIDKNNIGCEEVETITIDSLLDKYDNERVFIKIDVEGSEDSVIEGANHTILKKRPVIQCEINPLLNNSNCNNPYDIAHKKIIDYGYNSYFIRDNKMQPFYYNEYIFSENRLFNVLYLAKDSYEDLQARANK